MDPISMVKRTVSNWNDLGWWRHVASPFLLRKLVLQPYYRMSSKGNGVRIMDRDWYNLVILDGCRYDMFAEAYSGPGRLTPVRSLGSATPEFLHKNFDGAQHYDTVYVTANPQVNVHLEGVFHDVINVWETAWDEDLNTVHPERTMLETIEATRRYPDKRIISHFVQPHYPFIGEYGRTQIGKQAGVELSKRMADDEPAVSDEDHVWLQLRKGEVTVDSVKRAYYENLEITLPYVKQLIRALDGRTVVTSDHGNLYGQPGPFGIPIFGHPNGVHHTDLLMVPWLEIDGTDRRVTKEPPSVTQLPAGVSERLAELGYR